MSCASLPWTSTPNTKLLRSPGGGLRNEDRCDGGGVRSRSSNEDSAYVEGEYSSTGNRLSDEEDYGSSCPDYEELPCSEPALVYNIAGAEGELYSEFLMNNETRSPHSSFIASTDPDTRQKIMKSIVYCIHKIEGCKWSGQLCKLKGHLNTCQKDAMSCPNQCGSKIARVNMEDHMMYTCSKRLIPCIYCKKDFTGAVIADHAGECGFEPIYCENKCGQRIQRNRLKAHQVNSCSKRLVTCQYCSRSFTADTLHSHHSKCYMFPVPCPNRCEESGEGGIPREDVERHLAEECGKTASPRCPYRDAGCRFRSADPEEMDVHMKDKMSYHLDLMCSLVHKQQGHIKKLLNQVEQANTSYNGVLLWKIKNFSAKMKESKASEGLELVSVPFFTSQCGYKLQASLFLNGNGGGEGSHVSVYIKLLPGDYDSILKWPFKHTVSFSLLDQNENRKKIVNIVESFIPDPTWPNFRKPHVDQLGFGFPKFVSHAMLNTKDYIKDDCIFIKIRVDPARNVAV